MMKPYQPKPDPGSPPYVIAHRGISGKAPENTLAAIRLACETPGIDMIEIDVRLSKDGEVIVLHDRTLQRTTTGNGAASDYTLAELREFDAGSWFDPRFSRERIPTLREVLRIVDQRVWIDIELKSDFLFPGRRGALERRVLEVVEEAGANRFVLYSSFNHGLVANIKKLDPAATVGVLYNFYRDFGRLPSKLAARAGASVFVCARHELTRGMLRDAHQQGLAVYVYTLETASNIKRMMEFGVHGILSNNADDTVNLVKPRGKGETLGSQN